MSGLVQRMRFARDHRWAPDHMSAFLDGELPSRGRLRMERHAGECVECRRVLDGLRAMLDALHRLAGPTGTAEAVAVASAVRLRLPRAPEPD